MEKLSELEVLIIVALATEKALTNRELREITGVAPSTLRNALVKLRKKGLMRSNPVWKQSFLDLPMPREPLASSRGPMKIYSLPIDLEQIWQEPEFRRSVIDLFGSVDLNEIKRLLRKER